MSASALPGKTRTGKTEYKRQYFVGFVSRGSAEADNGCSEEIGKSLARQLCRNIGVKIIKI